MKRIIILMLACTMVFGAAVSSSAVEFKASGTFDMAFQWIDNPDPKTANTSNYFNALQRFRSQIDIIANESLRAVYYLEVGTFYWGDGSGQFTSGTNAAPGGRLGVSGINVETKRLFIDYRVPNTAMQIQMGRVGLALPALANLSPILDDDVTAVIGNYHFTDQFNVVATWARAIDTENYGTATNTSNSKYDVFAILLGLNFEEVTLVPYITYAAIGRNTLGDLGTTAAPQPATKDVDSWWLGLAAKSNNLGNLNLALDFVWGWADAAVGDANALASNPKTRDQSGFYVLAHGDYKMENFTPTLDLWYSSGDTDRANGSGNLMPTISPGGLALTNFGTDGGFYHTTDNAFTKSGVGTFGAVIGLTEVSFLENVTHDFKIAWMQGTSSYKKAVGSNNTFPTDEDRAWEFNIDTNWQMYENLAAIVELGYLNPDYKVVTSEKAGWKAALGFQFTY